MIFLLVKTKLFLSFLYKLGLQLKRFHRILESKQDPFLKPYIKHNRDVQREAEKEGNKLKKQKIKC